MKEKILGILVLLGVLLLCAGPVAANTINVSGTANLNPGLTALGSVTYNTTNSTFSGTMKFSNTTAINALVVAWSLQMFDGSTVISGLTASGAGWNDFYADDKQSNNGTACSTNTNKGWICADGFTGGSIPFTPGVIAAHGSTTFTFSGSYSGSIVPLDLMADGCATPNYTVDSSKDKKTGIVTYSISCNDNGAKWAYSAPFDAVTPPTPEPSSLLFLGSGLLGLALRRLRR